MLFVVPLALYSLFEETGSPQALSSMRVFGLGLMAVILAGYYIEIFWSAKNQFRHNPSLRDIHQIEITKDSISVQVGEVYSEFNMRDFTKCKSDNRIVLLYRSNGDFLLIPSRAFESENKRTEMLRYIENEILGSKK